MELATRFLSLFLQHLHTVVVLLLCLHVRLLTDNFWIRLGRVRESSRSGGWRTASPRAAGVERPRRGLLRGLQNCKTTRRAGFVGADFKVAAQSNLKCEFLKFVVFYRARTAVRRSSDGCPPTIRPSVDRPTRRNSAKNKMCLK